jgi:micrococcal nuclease
MKSLFAVVAAHKVAATVAAASMLVGAGAVHEAMGGSVVATVAGVVDGDTIDVRYDGATHRVRLLNVNTPETVDPDKPVECMGPEASDYLKSRLPVGIEVRLEHDEETRDGYGRELAAVFLGADLVNADIARQGLGVAMSIKPNTKFLPPVQSAQAEAQQAGRGLYGSDISCTIPAQVTALEQAATATVAEQPKTAAVLTDFDDHNGVLTGALATAAGMRGLLDGDRDAFPLLPFADAQLASLRARVGVVTGNLRDAVDVNTSARAAEQQRLDEAAREAAKKAAEEAARKAAEEAARAAAAERAEAAARAAADDAARRAAQKAATAHRPAPQPATSAGSSSRRSTSAGAPSAPKVAAPAESSSGSAKSGYTGCRRYAPGGKTWTPMPCPGS